MKEKGVPFSILKDPLGQLSFVHHSSSSVNPFLTLFSLSFTSSLDFSMTVDGFNSLSVLKDSGLKFTSKANQYIQIPGFIPAGQDLSVTTSIAFHFHLKIDQAPILMTTILSYYCNSTATEVFSLELSPSMKLTISLHDNTVEPSETLALGQWNTIYLAYALTYGGFGIGRIFMNEVSVYTTNLRTQNAPDHSAFSDKDIIKVGGVFTGEFRRVQIHSPAPITTTITTGASVCTTTCSAEIGYSNPPTCLKASCSTTGSYPSLGTCERKPAILNDF